MRLADFILRNMDTILGEWEAFAATLLPGRSGHDIASPRRYTPVVIQNAQQVNVGNQQLNVSG